jgi:hypothetical protein
MSSEMTIKVIPVMGNAHTGQRDSGHSVVSSMLYAPRRRTGTVQLWSLGTRILVNHRLWGVCEPVLKPQFVWKGWYLENGVQSRGQNRTREIRLSGIVGRLAETWAKANAIWAHMAETPKQTSVCLRSRAPYFYPDIRTSGSVRGVDVLLHGRIL